MKKVIVISTSLRTGSNSDIMADMFIKGASDAGHNVEKISLAGKTIAFCKGCLACQKLGKCVINDDANAIMQKVLEADIVLGNTHLLLRDERTDESSHRPHERHVLPRLQIP